MNKKLPLLLIINWFCVLLLIAAGITVIVLRHRSAQYDEIIIGSVLLVAGFTRIASYFLADIFVDPKNVSPVVGTAMVVLGFITLFGRYELETICFAWGIMELVASGIEIFQKSQHVKHEPLALIEIAIALGTLTFAIILCIKTTNGLTGHLIFLSISLILLGLYQAAGLIIKAVRGKKE